MKTRLLLSSSLLLLSVRSFGCGSDNPPPLPPPSAPTNVVATQGVQMVTVVWDAVAGATSYDIYWSSSAGVTTATGTKVDGLTASPYVHGSLAASTYYYVVSAAVSGGFLVWTGDHNSAATSNQATCTNWTSSLSTDSGWAGWSLDAGVYWSHFIGSSGCKQSRRLYCFED